MRRLILRAALALLCAGCAATSAPERSARAPLILISIDGFRADYLDRGVTPTLRRLADEGVRARWLTPSFPSKTFPNHYTIVTGLIPDHHGIVENTMVDPVLGQFTLKNRAAVGDGRWWGGEPLWVTAQRQGLRSATLFWPGSEAAIGGVRPADWRKFDAAMSLHARVDQVLAWLDRDDAARPDFITLYFEGADSAGHDFGPDSPQVDAALARIDAALARLIDGLRRRDLDRRANLVIVSDHGMAALAPERTLVLEDLVDPSLIEIVSLSEVSLFAPRLGRAAEAEAALLGRREGIECHRKSEIPAEWQYGSHPRVPAIVCRLDEGWRITRREAFNPWRAVAALKRGAHGYDPKSESMRALFVAHGPAFRRALVVEPFQNVHVYPLLARALGIDPAPNDGDPAVTAKFLSASTAHLHHKRAADE